MAKTKSAGATGLGRDSQPKYLGIKIYGGQKVKPGMIIVRQRGTKFRIGRNVKLAADDTIFALKSGVVRFQTKKIKRFDGSKKRAMVVNVEEEK